MMILSMECYCLRLHDLPHTTKLFAAFLDDFSRVASFYVHPPGDDGIRAAAREVRLDAATRRSVVEVLREQNRRMGADGATERNLDRLSSGAITIVTGQQVGLFSGPSYTFYKALTAIRVARELSERGTDAVPVFWLATEDHDLSEVNQSYWLDRRGEPVRLEVSVAQAEGRRVGEILLGESVTPAVSSVAELLDGPFAEEVARTLSESYRPEETFGTAFGKLMARAFAGRGVILLDPLDPRLHRLAAPLYRQAAEQAGELARELFARNKALVSAGFHTQVKVTERNTLLFVNVDSRRQPLRRRNSEFSAGGVAFSMAELLAAIEAAPENFSPNVLLRPVVQDALLPTAAYIGGPAEVAYFAQAEAVYRRLLGRMPAVLPRAGFTLVEPHVARLLRKYRLEALDVFRGRQHLRARMERESLPRELAREFASGERALRRLLGRLRTPIARLDKTLVGALENAERKTVYQYLKLRGKAGRAENLRSGVLHAHERLLLESLYPHHAPQERTWCFLAFFARHGPKLLDELEQRAGGGITQHQVLSL